MMENVIAFPQPMTPSAVRRKATPRAMTLFVHVRRTTLIAHLTGRVPSTPTRDGRVGRN